jgi:transcriptional regulator with XRE-family HTH domain
MWELSISERVRVVLRQLEVSQERFAEMLGTKRETVNKWARGRQTPTQYAAKIAAESGYPAEMFKADGPPGHDPFAERVERLFLRFERIADRMEKALGHAQGG